MSRVFLPYGRRGHVLPVEGAPALDLRAVSVRYPNADRLALHRVDLCVAAGARVALVGPNGAGKSTLIKAVAGILPLVSGTIAIYGHPVSACHHRVAYLAQRSEMDWHFPITVRRMVLTGRYPHLGWLRWPGREDWRRVDAALERLQLVDLAERQIGELSGGQQQRALLARALAQDAALLLLDEPFNAVDVATREVVTAVLCQLAESGKTILVATHDLDRMSSDYDDALFLVDGHPVARGLPEALRRAEAIFDGRR